tara:strand:+ start:1373 stop:2656 length:1284 start_codon:yes stop_codon:yes gene_type:complete
MILAYRILTKLIYPFLFILVLIRILIKKEDPVRYKEKIFVSHFNVKKNNENKLIWFHAASIGELKSIIPIINKLNSYVTKLDFLVTTNTLSSSRIAEIEFSKIKNVEHRFLPFDIEFLISNFLKLWKPSFILLVDSEIWPNLIFCARKNNISLGIINARITSKSYKRWMMFPKTASKIFSCFDLCLTSNLETKSFLKRLNAKNIHYNGNIKLINEIDENKINNLNENFLTNNKFWLAASTHAGEEELCIKTHLLLKKNIKNIFTLIAPRHIERSNNIKSLCERYNLATQILNDNELINPNKEIIIINSFGILKNYFKYAKSVFIGKSTLIKLKDVGGQNPLEAAQLRCKIYNGPYVYNFKDIYDILEKYNISVQITDHNDLSNYLEKDLERHNEKSHEISDIINNLSKKTLSDTIRYIDKFILNDAI